MAIFHAQETIVESFVYRGAEVALVEWAETLWCGKIGYAANNTDEPDVDAILRDFQAWEIPPAVSAAREADWDVCMSVNYLCGHRPNGVFFGFLVHAEPRADGFDILRVPSAQYIRVRMCEETARALGREAWHGGIPPYQWIGEQIAPEFGYGYGDDALPIVEYYGHYDPDKHAHEICYLYVPVEKMCCSN